MNKILLLLGFVFLISLQGRAQWSQLKGPEGGNLFALAGQGNDLFTAMLENGVCASADGGLSWTPRNAGLPQRMQAYCLGVCGRRLFMGTIGKGLYTSTDRGGSWTFVPTGFTDSVIGSISVSGSHVLIAGNEGIFHSADSGLTWTQTLQLGPAFALAAEGSRAYATVGGSAYASTDYGASWVSGGLLPPGGYYPGVMHIADTFVFVGDRGRGVFRSSFHSTTWTRMNATLPDSGIWAISHFGNKVFAGSNAGVFRSDNYGSTWTAVNTGLDRHTLVRSLYASGNTLFAGTVAGLYRSDANSIRWSTTHSGIPYGGVLALEPVGSTLFAGVGYAGVQKSSDNGATWTPVSSGLPVNRFVRSLARCRDTLFAGIDGEGVYVSRDRGNSWTVTGMRHAYIMAFHVAGDTLYACASDGLYFSRNCGASWTASPLGNHSVNNLAVSGDTMYAATGDTGVAVSTDRGATWQLMNDGLPDLFVNSVAISGNYVFARHNGLYRHARSGSGTWTKLNASLPDTSLFQMAAFGNRLVIATENKGPFYSQDSGATWIPLNMNFPVGKYVYTFAAVGNDLYAGTYGGLFRNGRLLGIAPVAAVRSGEASVYPNPLTGAGTVRLSGFEPNRKMQLRLYAIDGTQVRAMEVQNGTTTLERGDLASGVYLFRLFDGQAEVGGGGKVVVW